MKIQLKLKKAKYADDRRFASNLGRSNCTRKLTFLTLIKASRNTGMTKVKLMESLSKECES